MDDLIGVTAVDAASLQGRQGGSVMNEAENLGGFRYCVFPNDAFFQDFCDENLAANE